MIDHVSGAVHQIDAIALVAPKLLNALGKLVARFGIQTEKARDPSTGSVLLAGDRHDDDDDLFSVESIDDDI